MNRFKFAALSVAVLVTTWGCAQAPTKAPAPAPAAAASSAPAPAAAAAAAAPAAALSGDKAALIRQFIANEQGGIEDLARVLVTQSSDPIARAAAQYLQTKVPAEQRDSAARAADVELRRYFDETYPMVRDRALQLAPAALGPILDSNFSEAELRELNSWIASPVAKKYIDLNPQMQTALMRQVVTETRPQIEPKIRQLDVAVANALKAAGPPAAKSGAKSGGKAK